MKKLITVLLTTILLTGAVASVSASPDTTIGTSFVVEDKV